MTKKISALTNMNGAASIDRSADFIEISDSSGPASYKATPNFILGFSGGNPVSTSDTQNLTNKTLDNSNIITARDDRFTLQDNVDTTKQAQFQLSGITTGTTRTLTLPNASDTLVGRATTDTLTNKTISGGSITGATIDNPVLQTDTVSEHTSANGVTVDGLNIKDGKLNTNNSVVTNNITDAAVTPAKLVSGSGASWVWQSYTPTFTNLTVGNGVLAGFWTQVGKTVFGRVKLLFGSSSSVSGAVTFTLPTPSIAAYASTSAASQIGIGSILDAGSTIYAGIVYWSSTTNANIRVLNAAGTYVSHTDLSGAVPVALGTSDEIYVQFSYEAA